ncbi:MAG: acyltransferase [Candidatus Methanoperedens sp.]|nr:acyltransferase [Candidatus Methanoperedens sp.]MCZ7404843.1 acyltransferase [Candidatus Methanoperedens sp.]
MEFDIKERIIMTKNSEQWEEIYGKNVLIEPTAILIGINKIQIGDGSWIGSYCNLRPVNNKIIIGRNVIIAQFVSIISDSHNYEDITKIIKDQGVFGGDIIIKDNVWIGCNSVILHDLVIETGSVVAAGSVVTESVPPYCVVAGSPAKIVKRYSYDMRKWLKYNIFVRIMFESHLLK